MSFRPFGKKIDLYTPLPPVECRRRLEAKFVPAWERPDVLRPRGRFFGRLLIMWLGTYDWLNHNSEAKLIVRLKFEGDGTRISGATIPGIQFILLLIPATVASIWGSLALLAYQPNQPPADQVTYIIVKMVVALFPLSFVTGLWWIAHGTGRSGRPLMSFLKRTLSITDAGSCHTILPPRVGEGED